MDSNPPRTEADQAFHNELFQLAWAQCLKENGLQGAIGCAHLAREAADAAFKEARGVQ
jgi:hypothetical protein